MIDYNLTLFSVPDLVQKRFPDALFGRLRDPRDAKGNIKLVPDPRLPPTPAEQDEERTEETSTDQDVAHEPEGDTPDARAAPFLEKMNSKRRASDPPVPVPAYHMPRFLDDTEGAPEAATLEAILELVRYDHKHLYDPSTGRWQFWDNIGQEGHLNMAAYLNLIVACAYRYFGNDIPMERLGLDRYFWPGTVLSECSRKSDVVVCRNPYAGEPTWRHVCAFGMSDISETFPLLYVARYLDNYAHRCFAYQHDRRFVLGLSIAGDTMRLWKFDRSGVLSSKAFDIHKRPLDFLRVIVGLAFGDEHYLGFDPSFSGKEFDRHVRLNSKDYRIIRTLQADPSVGTKGTSIFLVKDPESGKELIMKDQWVERELKTKEFEAYQILKKYEVPSVAKLIDYQLVRFGVDGRVVIDSTEDDKASKKNSLVTRDHYRLLITPYGEPVTDFRSLEELVLVFKDYADAIWRSYRAGVLHRDISPGNLIIADEDGSSTRRGYIIDFDRALILSRTEGQKAEFAGTLAFMAIEMLWKNGCVHKCMHDLESLFYVLVFICFTEDRSKGKDRPASRINDFPLNLWYRNFASPTDYREIAWTKHYTICERHDFQKEYLSRLPSYFKPLKSLLKSLRDILFMIPSDNDDYIESPVLERKDVENVFLKMMDAFEATLVKLPDGNKS